MTGERGDRKGMEGKKRNIWQYRDTIECSFVFFCGGFTVVPSLKAEENPSSFLRSLSIYLFLTFISFFPAKLSLVFILQSFSQFIINIQKNEMCTIQSVWWTKIYILVFYSMILSKIYSMIYSKAPFERSGKPWPFCYCKSGATSLQL